MVPILQSMGIFICNYLVFNIVLHGSTLVQIILANATSLFFFYTKPQLTIPFW